MNVGGPELLIILLVLVLAVVPVILITWVVTSNTRRPPPPPAVMTVPGAVGTTSVRTIPPTGSGPGVTGRWYADPTGRFAQRWWDGATWTADVVLAGGQQTADPAPLPDPPPAPPA